jgi:predicted nucleic acid-binding protein
VIVLDASVLIAHLDAADVHHQRATELLVNAADETLGASPLTLAEVLVGPARAGTIDAARAALAELAVVVVPLNDEAPARLAVLRATSRLRLPDCCVLLAAETEHAGVATFDDKLADAATQFGLAAHR